MKRSRFSGEQIIGILKEHKSGVAVADLCRKHGVSDVSIYEWNAKFGGMGLFQRSDPDFPTTPAVQQRLIAAGRVESEGSLRRHDRRHHAVAFADAIWATTSTQPRRSLLADRASRDPTAARSPNHRPTVRSRRLGRLRKTLAMAKRTGTLGQVNEQVIADFAVVFSLSSKHLMRLKDILLPQAED